MQQHFPPGTVRSYYSLSGRTPPPSKLSTLKPDLERTVSALKPVLEILKELATDCAWLEANAVMEDPASGNAVALRMLKGQIEMTATVWEMNRNRLRRRPTEASPGANFRSEPPPK